MLSKKINSDPGGHFFNIEGKFQKVYNLGSNTFQNMNEIDSAIY
jgi:hypothetical protein